MVATNDERTGPEKPLSWPDMQAGQLDLGDEEWRLASEGANLTYIQEFVLYYHLWEGMSFRKIADYGGVNPSTVLKSLRGAKGKVKAKQEGKPLGIYGKPVRMAA